jgi:hypothetical protein
MPVIGNAQETLPPPLPPAVGLGRPEAMEGAPVAEDATIRQLYQAVKQLEKQREGLISDFAAEQRDATHYSSSRARHSTDLGELRRFRDRRRSEEQLQAERLQQKLDRIRQLVQNGLNCAVSTDQIAGNESTAPVVPAEAEPTGGTDANVPSDVPGNNREPEDAVAADEPTQSSSDETTALTATPQLADPQSADVGSASPSQPGHDQATRNAFALIDEPVDRVRMADNLYGAGEVKLALEVYQGIDRNQLSESGRLWVAYQIANCFHRLGKPSEAESGYRVVTGMSRDGWISQNARWWLEVNDKARSLEAQVKQLDAIYQQLQEISNGNPGTP